MKKIKTILALILVISYNLICYRYWLRVWVWSTCLTGRITWFLFTILHSKSTWEILAVMLEIISLKYTFFRFINQSISWFRYNCNICIALKCFIVWKFFIILINNDIVLVFHRHTSYICMILPVWIMPAHFWFYIHTYDIYVTGLSLPLTTEMFIFVWSPSSFWDSETVTLGTLL